MVIPISIGVLGTFTKEWIHGLENLEIGEQVETIQIKIRQNTEKSPGDLRRLAVTSSIEKPSAKGGVIKLSKK